jgi:hypothetical protein
MLFPYDRYKTLKTLAEPTAPISVYYPTGEEEFARWVFQSMSKAGNLLTTLLGQPMPELQFLLAAPADWQLAPHEELEELNNPHPYWTDTTSPPSIVVPLELDPIFGEPTLEKLAFMLYHELTLAYLENDPRPYPNDYPLWADEWQLKFAALWIAQQLSGQQGIVNKDLHEKYAEIFEPEEDGKTPITIRGFDWYDDTIAEDYLCYELLLEQLAADLLKHNGPEVLPRFLTLYRKDHKLLLSDEVTAMLGDALGPGGTEWLEELAYF